MIKKAKTASGIGGFCAAVFCAVALCLGLAAPRAASAQYVATSDLLKMCMSEDKTDMRGCVHYVAGVIDYHIMMQSLGTAPTIDFCLPQSITMPQAAVIVVAYLRQNPGHDAFIAAGSIPLAMNKVFPCKPPAKKK